MADMSASAGPTVWTIGHSNHRWEKFLELAQSAKIAVLADVRSTPYCRYASHFNHDVMAAALRGGPVGYWYLGPLLGCRALDEEFYDHLGHVRYDRLAERPEFRQGIEQLLDRLRGPGWPSCAAKKTPAPATGDC